MAASSAKLLGCVRACTACDALPLGPRPLLQLGRNARILIAGQAPGKKAHTTGVPFDDASGERLRGWFGLARETFYDADRVAILPMAFCYPGTGTSGDLPPPPRCAQLWREPLLQQLPRLDLTVIIGRYARDWHLPAQADRTLTASAQDWQSTWPRQCVLPHPSPRNNRWLKRNPWFERDAIPRLQARVQSLV